MKALAQERAPVYSRMIAGVRIDHNNEKIQHVSSTVQSQSRTYTAMQLRACSFRPRL
uniref:Uncharacterized protein n=1 Tax=Physcomitrium patens TaxID=3218 RepID=A0A2K1K300_PHYPA|nr:hypothetical protein PHYPA_012626 [Physcomitrium patens]